MSYSYFAREFSRERIFCCHEKWIALSGKQRSGTPFLPAQQLLVGVELAPKKVMKTELLLSGEGIGKLNKNWSVSLTSLGFVLSTEAIVQGSTEITEVGWRLRLGLVPGGHPKRWKKQWSLYAWCALVGVNHFYKLCHNLKKISGSLNMLWYVPRVFTRVG